MFWWIFLNPIFFRAPSDGQLLNTPGGSRFFSGTYNMCFYLHNFFQKPNKVFSQRLHVTSEKSLKL